MRILRKILGGLLMSVSGFMLILSFVKEKPLVIFAMLPFSGSLMLLGIWLFLDRKGKAAQTHRSRHVAAPAAGGILRFFPRRGKKCPSVVIADYLALPLPDGSDFCLFDSVDDAALYIRQSGQPGLTVRELTDDIMKRELVEYLCSGYDGALIMERCGGGKSFRRRRRLSREQLIGEYRLPDLKSAGSIAPDAGKRMRNYLKQVRLTELKYGGFAAAPGYLVMQLEDLKGQAVRSLLGANLCLPAKQEREGPVQFSVLTAVLPSGQKWAALFTDMFAIRRYAPQFERSIVFPGLLTDTAANIRKGEIRDVAGIMINPGREEFKITVHEIEEIEKGETAGQPTGAAPDPEPGPARPLPDEFVKRVDAAADSAPGPMQRIDLNAGGPPSVSPGRSFFVGLLPSETAGGEKPGRTACSSDTEGFVPIHHLEVGNRWDEFSYDPAYRRFVIDTYTAAGLGNWTYLGRDTILPLDLIDRFNRYPEDRNPRKVALIRRIQKIMTEEEGFGNQPPGFRRKNGAIGTRGQ